MNYNNNIYNNPNNKLNNEKIKFLPMMNNININNNNYTSNINYQNKTNIIFPNNTNIYKYPPLITFKNIKKNNKIKIDDIIIGNEKRRKNQIMKKKNKNFVNKIKINKCYLCICFLFIKSRKNLQNILVNEGMGIITQYLDVLNIFKKLYRDGKIQEELQKEKDDIIEMSDECCHKLSKLE